MKNNKFLQNIIATSEQALSFLERRVSWLWVLFIAFIWLAATTWMYPLLLPDEGRYVGVAWHMLVSGDFLTPRLDGMAYFHKPPLFYWLTALSLSVFGENAWAARLVSVLSATGLVTCVYLFLRRYTNINAARYTALILLIQPFLFGAAHYANLDMLVAFLMCLTVMAGADAVLRHEQLRHDRISILLMYVAAALGFLAKGLIGVVLPAAILFFWLLGRRQYKTIVRLLWWPGIVLFLLLVLPWMLAMQSKFSDFFQYYIIHQHFQRFLEPGFNNPHPFWFYIPIILGLTLPWSIQLWRWFYPHGPLKPVFLQPAQRIEQVNRPVIRGLMLSWLLVVLVFFSIPQSKLVGYVIATLPPLAWFIQETFEQRIAEGKAAKRSYAIHVLVAALLCLLAVLALVIFPQRSTKPLAQTIAASAQPGDKLFMLGQYAFDTPMYANWQEPVIAVTNWDDPDLPLGDDWRRELYDAAKFEPALGLQRLWLKQGLHDYLCGSRTTGSWLIAWLDEAKDYPVLNQLEPVKSAHKMGLWFIGPDTSPVACGEMPNSGLK